MLCLNFFCTCKEVLPMPLIRSWTRFSNFNCYFFVGMVHISLSTQTQNMFFWTKYLKLEFKVSNTEIIILRITQEWSDYFVMALVLQIITDKFHFHFKYVGHLSILKFWGQFAKNMLKTHSSVKSFYNVSNASYSHWYRLLRYLFD